MNDGGWMSGARQWWATHAVFKKAEATQHLHSAQAGTSYEHTWGNTLLHGALQAVEVLAVLALFLGVVFLLIWLFG